MGFVEELKELVKFLAKFQDTHYHSFSHSFVNRVIFFPCLMILIYAVFYPIIPSALYDGLMIVIFMSTPSIVISGFLISLLIKTKINYTIFHILSFVFSVCIYFILLNYYSNFFNFKEPVNNFFSVLYIIIYHIIVTLFCYDWRINVYTDDERYYINDKYYKSLCLFSNYSNINANAYKSNGYILLFYSLISFVLNLVLVSAIFKNFLKEIFTRDLSHAMFVLIFISYMVIWAKISCVMYFIPIYELKAKKLKRIDFNEIFISILWVSLISIVFLFFPIFFTFIVTSSFLSSIGLFFSIIINIATMSLVVMLFKDGD